MQLGFGCFWLRPSATHKSCPACERMSGCNHAACTMQMTCRLVLDCLRKRCGQAQEGASQPSSHTHTDCWKVTGMPWSCIRPHQHHKICKYFQSTSRAHAEVQQNLTVRSRCLQQKEHACQEVDIPLACAPTHSGIQKHLKNTNEAQAEVLQNLEVPLRILPHEPVLTGFVCKLCVHFLDWRHAGIGAEKHVQRLWPSMQLTKKCKYQCLGPGT